MTVFCTTHTRWRKGQASVIPVSQPKYFLSLLVMTSLIWGSMCRLDIASKMYLKEVGFWNQLNCTSVGQTVMADFYDDGDEQRRGYYATEPHSQYYFQLHFDFLIWTLLFRISAIFCRIVKASSHIPGEECILLFVLLYDDRKPG
jgi:hypothetical protein